MTSQRQFLVFLNWTYFSETTNQQMDLHKTNKQTSPYKDNRPKYWSWNVKTLLNKPIFLFFIPGSNNSKPDQIAGFLWNIWEIENLFFVICNNNSIIWGVTIKLVEWLKYYMTIYKSILDKSFIYLKNTKINHTVSLWRTTVNNRRNGNKYCPLGQGYSRSANAICSQALIFPKKWSITTNQPHHYDQSNS